jgi:hypothetical protein
MPAFARKSPETNEKETLEEQTKKIEPVLPKSINLSAVKYPSPPGVEGAPARPARLTARGTSPEST